MVKVIRLEGSNALITNCNGRNYLNIYTLGKYTLVKDLVKMEYVVVYNLQQHTDGLYSWGSGNYYLDLNCAMECLNRKGLNIQ